MFTQEDALQLIQDSMDSLIRSGTIETEKVKVTHETVLLGEGALLDSIGFVTFVTDMEDRMEEKTGHECYLVLNEIGEFNINSPSLKAEVLSRYLVKLAQEEE
jgi:hypothetical protein